MRITGLDETDNHILTSLAQNARKSYSDIAAELGISRTSVKNRMAALEQRGVITGYEVRINGDAASDNGVRFLITIETCPAGYEDVVNILTREEYIRQIYSMTGSGHIVACGTAPDSKNLDVMNRRMMRLLTEVKSFRLDIIASTLKDVDGGIKYVRCEKPKHMEGVAAEQSPGEQ